MVHLMIGLPVTSQSPVDVSKLLKPGLLYYAKRTLERLGYTVRCLGIL